VGLRKTGGRGRRDLGSLFSGGGGGRGGGLGVSKGEGRRGGRGVFWGWGLRTGNNRQARLGWRQKTAHFKGGRGIGSGRYRGALDFHQDGFNLLAPAGIGFPS